LTEPSESRPLDQGAVLCRRPGAVDGLAVVDERRHTLNILARRPGDGAVEPLDQVRAAGGLARTDPTFGIE